MTTLPEIFKKAMQLENDLIDSGGELSPDLEKAHIEIMTELALKGESYALVVERLGNAQEYYEAKAEKYKKIARGVERTRGFLKNSLKTAMTELGVKELSGPDIKIKLQNSPEALEIVDEALIPSHMKKVVVSPDTALIKASLKQGETVPGASLKQDTHIRFYPSRGGR